MFQFWRNCGGGKEKEKKSTEKSVLIDNAISFKDHMQHQW
jgi:hypothetical protein